MAVEEKPGSVWWGRWAEGVLEQSRPTLEETSGGKSVDVCF